MSGSSSTERVRGFWFCQGAFPRPWPPPSTSFACFLCHHLLTFLKRFSITLKHESRTPHRFPCRRVGVCAAGRSQVRVSGAPSCAGGPRQPPRDCERLVYPKPKQCRRGEMPKAREEKYLAKSLPNSLHLVPSGSVA